jgi:hypothetical protein
MTLTAFRYTFDDALDMTEVEASFVLAIFAVESIHGESDTRLSGQHAMDLEKRSCVVDASTAVGRDLNRLFVGFLRREFGEDSFHVERIPEVSRHPALNGTTRQGGPSA